MKKFIALTVSALFNPIFLFAVAFSWLVLATKQNLGFYLFFLSTIYLPVVVYVLWFVYVKHKGNIKLLVWNRKERDGIYLMGAYTSLFASIFFSQLGVSFWTYNAVLTFILFGSYYLLNKYLDKASLHAGVFAFLVFYLTNLNLAFILLLIFLPLIWWSRFYLHKHTRLQLFLGTVAGMVIGILSWAIVIKN